MLNFNCATWSLTPGHNFRWWAKLTSIFLSYHFTLKNKLDFKFVSYHGSNNRLLHHSFDLMSSLIDYIVMKSLDKCVVIIINILGSSKISIEFLMRNTILWPRWFVFSSTTLLPSHQHKLVRVWCYTLSSLLSSNCSSLPWSITIFYVKYVVRISPPRMKSWYSDTSPHHHSFLVPVLFLKRIPTNGLWCVNAKLLATLLLWSHWSIVSFYVYGLMNHHSNIDCAT